jgi:hypothetical protein
MMEMGLEAPHEGLKAQDVVTHARGPSPGEIKMGARRFDHCHSRARSANPEPDSWCLRTILNDERKSRIR